MISDYKDGGAKMLDIFAFNKALKVTWVTRYLDDNYKGKWKNTFRSFPSWNGWQKPVLSNLNKTDLWVFKLKDKLVKEIV